MCKIDEVVGEFGSYAPNWGALTREQRKFEDEEVGAMLEQVGRDELDESADIHFRFALGKAFEDKKEYDQAWEYYHSGNQRRRMTVKHEALEMENRQTALKTVYNREFLQERSGHGYDAPDPILIVGLPRSGSTLVEQILAGTLVSNQGACKCPP